MHYKLLLVTGIAVFLLSGALLAQQADIRFDFLTPSDGLSQSTVQSILQDRDGYMWFGTQDGLNKYDGYNITVYRTDPDTPRSLSNNDIRVIYEDRKGDLWIGTQAGGLNRYNRATDDFIVFSGDPEKWQTLSDNTVWAIHEDSHGIFWVGTAYGLNIMDRDSKTFLRLFSEEDNPQTLSHNQINTIYEDSEGTIWVGTVNGLNKYNRKEHTFTRFMDKTSSEPYYIRSIYEDHLGTLWVGTEGQGLFSFNRETETFLFQYYHNPDDPESIAGNTISAITEDSRGNLWIGTANQGLDIFDRDNNIFYHHRSLPEDPYSLNNNGINSLYESKEGIFWAGTYAGGINFIDPAGNRFLHYSHSPMNPKSLSNNSVLSFSEDHSGNLWIGTDGGGLNLFDSETGYFRHFRHNKDDSGSPSSDVILDMHQNSAGIWLGTYGGGLDLLTPENQTFQSHYKEENSRLSSNQVFVIHENSSGDLWLGTNRGGINVLDTESGDLKQFLANPYNAEDSATVNNNDIREIYEDRAGTVWIGSYGGYLTRFQTADSLFSFYDVNENQRFFSNVIQDITEDRQNRLWLATRGGGLKLFNRETAEITSYTTDNGLSSNIVHAIVEDDNGNLWLSTNNGISKFNPDAENFLNYHTDHGIQGREFNPRASYKNDDGFIFFGGVNGFNKFHPDSVTVDSLVTPVILTDFMIFNENVPIGGDSPLQKHISQADEVVLPYNASVITFGFSTLNFHSIKGNQFAYKMDGFEENWNYVGSQRQATYTNLNPGKYIFKVKTSNRDGFWAEEGAALSLIITPPFWKTYWFLSLLVVAFSAGMFLLYRLRIRAIRQQNIQLATVVSERTSELKTANKTKEKLFSVIAHDLNNSAAGIVGLAEILKDSAENDRMDDLKTYTSLLHQSADRFASLLKNLLTWARSQTGNIEYKPHSFSIADITDEVIGQEESRAFNKHISLRNLIDPELNVFADRNMVSVILRNLLQNALKFTEKGGEIVVSAAALKNHVEISVSDNGIGMDNETLKNIFNEGQQVIKQGTSNEKGTGLGLPLCADFIRKNGGEVRAESKKGSGTNIIFTLPSGADMVYNTGT